MRWTLLDGRLARDGIARQATTYLSYCQKSRHKENDDHFTRAAERLSRPSLDDTHGHIAAFRVIYGIHQRRRRPSKEVSCGRASLPSNNAIDSSSTATIKSTLRPVLCEPAAPHYLPHPRCLPRYGRPISFDPSLIRIERACRKLSARYCR